ncbi:MAG: TIGR02281 family clan AA aspartic protease [Notoacmeibacter sp.]|nr:TIGR02281 family clan AA aspartic protease [Notoacmeibacter sp.]
MLKKIVAAAIIVGSGASVPLIYESSPETFERLMAGSPSREAAPEQVTVASISPKESEQVTGALSGRRHSVAMDAQGHFRDDFKLNGRRVTALIDTGATLVAINRSTARRIGIKLEKSDFKYEVNTANGVTHAASATIDRLQIGRVEMLDVKAVVLEDKALTGTLIGMSFLKRLDSFKVEGRELLLEQ